MTDTPLQAAGITEKRKYLSFSQLNVYQQCGTKFDLSYVHKAPREPQGAFLGGIAVHDSIAVAEDAGWWKDAPSLMTSEHPLLATFHEKFDELVKQNGGAAAIRWGGKMVRGHNEDKPWWDTNGEFMLRRYAVTRQTWHDAGLVSVPGGTEMRVVTTLPGVSLPVVGYLDKFLARRVDPDTGELLGHGIVDWKTGQIGRAEPFQFATYARQVRVALDIDVEWGLAVFLRAADEADRLAPVIFQGLVEHIDEVYATLGRGIEAGEFLPKPSSYCSSCSVRDACWYWKATNP
jgi:hypothetical protein